MNKTTSWIIWGILWVAGLATGLTSILNNPSPKLAFVTQGLGLLPWCIYNGIVNDVWDPSNSTSIVHNNTTGYYIASRDTWAIKSLNGQAWIVSAVFDVDTIYKWNQLKNFWGLGNTRDLQTIATTVNSNTACPAMTLSQFDNTYANPPSNYVAQQRWAAPQYKSVPLNNLATNNRLCVYYKVRGSASYNLERLEYNCTVTDLKLTMAVPNISDIDYWIAGSIKLKERFTIENLTGTTNNQPLTLHLTGMNKGRILPINSTTYAVSLESNNGANCPSNGTMNNQWKISFSSNFTIAAGKSCTYSILLPYTNPPFNDSNNNQVIFWTTYVDWDVNEPITVKANNKAFEQTPLHLNSAEEDLYCLSKYDYANNDSEYTNATKRELMAKNLQALGELIENAEQQGKAPVCPIGKICDLNKDGEIDTKDLSFLGEILRDSNPSWKNGDDVLLINLLISNGLPVNCEEYCGDNICQANEKDKFGNPICKADCKWPIPTETNGSVKGSEKSLSTEKYLKSK